jgi:transposase
VSLLTDLEGSRVLEVVEDRSKAAADQLWQTLTPPQREQVLAVAVDLWEPFMASADEQVPQAEILHDKFHVVKHLNEAIDKVRRQKIGRCVAEATTASREASTCGCRARTA